MNIIDRINSAKYGAAVRAVLKNLNEIGVDAGEETGSDMVTLEEAVREIVEKHGGIRAASAATGVDKSFISRVLSGKNTAPSSDVLEKLGLNPVPLYATVQAAKAQND